MADERFVPSDVWLEELLDGHASEVERRGLQVRRELDHALVLRRSEAGRRTLDRLLRFAFATVPDGCEVFVASARSAAPVTPVGEGELTLRWQVVGPGGDRPAEEPAPIRPVPGGARTHVHSTVAGELRAACEALGWSFELTAASRDRELFLRVRVR